MGAAAFMKMFLWRAPLILKKVIMHGVGFSPVSGKQDLRTELTVAIIRSFMSFNYSIGVMQKRAARAPEPKGPMWISDVTIPPPEDDVRDAVVRAIEDLKTGDGTYEVPTIVPVEAEWTGHRSGVDKNEPLPKLSEEEKYRELLKEAPADMVILYFHGGAYFLMDPRTHRVPVAHLSKRTGAPVLSVRYRLAPQNPFPAALVDALVAYLSLISPPPGSFHKPVPANKIVISGDSAGGNLSLALLQTLLTLQRASSKVQFHGRTIPIELPAGVATTAPWCDTTRSMPSIFNNARFDYLDPPPVPPYDAFYPLPFPADNHWPAKPPRVDLFVNADMVLHPLVSPLATPKELWKGAPPVFISVGEEALSDEGMILARRLHQAGVPVVVEQFEGMPHCFGLIMITTPAGRRFFDSYAGFCRDAAASRLKGDTGNLTYIGFKLRSIREIALDKPELLSDEEVDKRLLKSRHLRVVAERELQSQWRERARL